MKYRDIFAGLFDGLTIIGFVLFVAPFAAQFSYMIPIVIISIYLLVYIIIRVRIVSNWGVPFPWDATGWKEYTEETNE